MELKEVGRAGRRRRRSLRRETLVSVGLASLIAVQLHYLASRFSWRRDWSRTGFYRLSEKTRAVLDALQQDVDAIIVLKSGHPDLHDVQTLLREYQIYSRRLRVARVDPERSPARIESLMQRYPLTEPNVVIFAAAGRARIVPEREWIELEPESTTGAARSAPRRRAFHGEAAFTAAIQSLVSKDPPVVYFAEGHGEKSIDSTEPISGLSQLARMIRQDNIEVRTLSFGETARIPEDAAAVVFAGPLRPIPQPSLDLIQNYLERSGRAVFLIDAGSRSGLENVLSRWGVELGEGMVVDPLRTLSGYELILRDYVAHEITVPLKRLGYCVLYRPRAVEAGGSGWDSDRPKTFPLARTSARAWEELDLDSHPPRFDPQHERAGPITVAVAIERGGREAADTGLKPTRFVVIGDSQFVANRVMSGANGDFFLSALRWVIESREPMGIAPKPIEEVRLALSRGEMRLLAAALIVGWPGVFAICGAVILWWRRR